MMMAYTLAQKSALEAAIASGATTVSYEGKSVSYRSLSEIRQVLAEVTAALAGSKPKRQVRMFTKGDKGL